MGLEFKEAGHLFGSGKSDQGLNNNKVRWFMRENLVDRGTILKGEKKGVMKIKVSNTLSMILASLNGIKMKSVTVG